MVEIKQYPGEIYSGTITKTPISPSTYPIFSTFVNTGFTNVYNDYRYNVNLIDENGTGNTYTIAAQTTDLFGTLSVINFIDSSLVAVYQPTITDIVNCPSQIKNYRLEVTPYNNKSELSASTAITDTFFVMKASYNNIRKEYYGKSLLVDILNKTLSTNSYATNKSLFGIYNDHSSTFTVDINSIKYVLTKPDGSEWSFKLENIISLPTMVNNQQLQSTDDFMIEFPTGPQNIMDSSRMFVTKIIDAEGHTTYPETIQPITIEDGANYKYATYLDADQISQWYYIDAVSCYTRYKPLTLNFTTLSGGFDAVTFYQKNEKKISNEQKSYLKFPYEREGDYYYKTNIYNRGFEVYQDNIVEEYVLSTNWLNNEEIVELEELWTSPDVYLQVNDELVPVILSDSTKVIYNEKSPGLKEYTVSVIVSDKKYRI